MRPEHLLPENFGKPEDRVERCPQLVAHGGEELRFCPVRLFGSDRACSARSFSR